MDSIRSLDARGYLSSCSWAVCVPIGLLSVISFVMVMGLFSSKNHMPVEGRTVLLTGASEGMGRSVACQLSAKGAHIIIVARNADKLEKALDEIKIAAKSPSTQRFTYLSADVSQPDYAARVVASAKAWNGGRAPDIVWCVAGLSSPTLWADPATDSVAACRRNMDVNFFGSADMARAILLDWLSPAHSATTPASEPKHLVFTASVLAFFAVAGYGPYTPTKWALRGLADTLEMELALYPSNPVRIHVVCPGTILTAGLARENETKPHISLELEKADPKVAPDDVAREAIAGLERGDYYVATSWMGELMRRGAMGSSARNNWLVDTLVGWVMPFVYAVVLRHMYGTIGRWAKKYGHPFGYAAKGMK